MIPFFHFVRQLFTPLQTQQRNYRGILSLRYRWSPEDHAEQQQSKTTRLKKKMLDLVATQKKAQIRERIQFLSNNFLNPIHHEKNE